MEELQKTLEETLSKLPPDANPFTAIDQYLVEFVSPPRRNTFRIQIITCMVLHGLCFIFVVASVVVRICRRTFWLVHFRNQNPKLWRPHFTAGWSIWAAALSFFLQIAMYKVLTTGNTLDSTFAWWYTMTWIPAWPAGYNVAWGIGVSLLLHVHSNGQTAIVDRLSPFVNAASILLPSIYFALIIPFAVLSSIQFGLAIDRIADLRDLLHAAAATYDGHFSLTDLTPAYPLLAAVFDHLAKFKHWIRFLFACYAAGALFLLIVIIILGKIYLRLLREALSQAQEGATAQEERTTQRRVQKTYQNIFITVVSFAIIASIFFGVSLTIAIRPTFLTDRIPAQIVALIAFYSFALFGLPASFLLLVRSFDRVSNLTASSSFHASQSKSGKLTKPRSRISSFFAPERQSESLVPTVDERITPRDFELIYLPSRQSSNHSNLSKPFDRKIDDSSVQVSFATFSHPSDSKEGAVTTPQDSPPAWSSTKEDTYSCSKSNILHDSTSTKATSTNYGNPRDSRSITTLSPQRSAFSVDEDQTIDAMRPEAMTGGGRNPRLSVVGMEPIGRTLSRSPSPPFVFGATSNVH